MLNHQHQNLVSQYDGENIRGVAVLSFPHVELEKSKAHSSSKSTTTLGTLNVFYFSHYQLFILQLNDWKYALLPNLMVTGTKRADKLGYIYTMPHEDGFHHLKIDSMALDSAIKNFETVLLKSADFYYVTNGIKYKPSPNPVQRCRISGNKPYPVNANAVGMVGQDNTCMAFERKRDRFKRKLKNIAEKFSRKTKVEESENLNMTQIRSFESIKGTTKAMAPVIRFHKQEIEQTIINANSIVRSLHPHPNKNSQFNEGISTANRHPAIMVTQDHRRESDRIQIKTNTPINDFKAAVNRRADEIAEQIAMMQMTNNDQMQTEMQQGDTLLKKDLSVISEKSDEFTLSESGNGSTKDDNKEVPSISQIQNLSHRILSHQSTGDTDPKTPENVLQMLNKSSGIPGLRATECGHNHSMDEGYKNTTIESLPITLKHSEG